MVLLIDTNIIIDMAANRTPFMEKSIKVIELCAVSKATGYLSSRSFCDIFYILRKDMSPDQRKAFIKDRAARSGYGGCPSFPSALFPLHGSSLR